MAYTNFPDGITSMGVPAVGNSIPTTSGNYYFVDSATGSNGNEGTSMGSPLGTVAFAVTKCVAGNGDVIVVLPGHTETVASATALPLDKAGVSIVGLGSGGIRPTFTLSTANTSTIAVSADNVSVSNCIFVANFLSIAAAFTLSTAKNFTLAGNTFTDASGSLNFLNIVKSTGGANTVDGLTAAGNIWNSLGTTSVNSFVLSANAVDRLSLQWNRVNQVTTVDAAILLTVTTGVLTNFDCGYNKGYRKNTTTANGSLINVGGTTSTGFVYNNYVQTLTTSADVLFTTTVGLSAFNNYVTGVVGASGFLIPAADS